MTEIVLLINRSKKFIVLFCLILLLGAIGIQWQQRQELPSEKIAAPSLEGDALPASVRLEGGFKLPRWGNVYRITESSIPLTKSWAEAVGEKFSFASPPRVSEGKTFIWSDSKKWLNLGESAAGEKYLHYGLDLLSDPSLVGSKGEDLPSGPQAAEAVHQFLVEKGLAPASQLVSLETHPPQLVAVRGPRWVNVNEESEADALRLMMAEEIEEIPIFELGTEGPGSLTAYVGRGGKILKLNYSWSERDYQLLDRYPLRSLDDALTDGKVIEVIGGGLEGMTIELQTLSIASVTMGYFADSSSGLVYPVFVCQGTGRSKEGKSLQATVLAPAISPRWIE